MKASEQFPETLAEIMVEQPENEPLAQAIYVPGFGDTPDGPFGRLLRRRLLEGGIAVATVLSSKSLGENSGLQTVPLSIQAEGVLAAIEQSEGASPNLPIHVIGMSQGGIAISDAFLHLQDESREPNGAWFAINTPATGPAQRLNPFPSLIGYLRGTVLVESVQVGVTHKYWDEVEDPYFDPLAQLEAAYQHPAFNVILADQDEVLGSDAHYMREAFERVEPNRVHVIGGANHRLTNEGGKHRRHVVDRLVGKLLLHTASNGGNLVFV